MAGDWIKMRGDLAEDPAVIDMAASLGMDEDHVVGKLHRLWSWADRQSRDGHARGVTEKWLDKETGVTGFARALQSVGWVVFDSTGMTIPNFDRHNGETAKTRALAGKRKKKQRANEVTNASRTKRDKRVTREEKRRAIEQEQDLEQKKTEAGHHVTAQTGAGGPAPEDHAAVRTYPGGFEGGGADAGLMQSITARHELAVLVAAKVNSILKSDPVLSPRYTKVEQAIVLGATLLDFERAALDALDTDHNAMWAAGKVLGQMQDKRDKPQRQTTGAAADLGGKDYAKGATPEDQMPAYLRLKNNPEEAT